MGIILSSGEVMVPPTKSAIEGKLYYIGNPPSGQEKFWIQQYPTYFGERGRLVVEFWDNDKVAAVVSIYPSQMKMILIAYVRLTYSSKVSLLKVLISN